jgi:uncharacterized protein YbjT (DUF2867 family)
MQKKMLVVGATGIVGHTALEHFAASDDWDAVAVSRRKPVRCRGENRSATQPSSTQQST